MAAGGLPEVLAEHHTRLGEALEEARPDKAVDSFLSALQYEDGNLSAIRGLSRIAERGDEAALALEALRAEAQWTASPEGAADLLVKSARVAVMRLEDLEAAAEDLEKALTGCPEHVPAAEGLSQLLRGAGQVDRLIETLTRAAQATNKTNRRAELWRTVALLHADDKQNLQAGIVALERVIRDESDHVPTLSQLATLYSRNAQWKEAADALERVVKLGPSRELLAQSHLELAQILIEHLDNRKDAQVQLEALLRIDGSNREALGLLLEIHARDGDLKGAMDVGRRLMRASQGAPERANALLTIGRMQLRAGEREAAAESLREAIALGGPASSAAVEYKRMLGNEEPWSKYVDALRLHRRQVEAGAIEDDELQLTFLELARVQHDQLDDAEAGFSILREGLEVCGDLPELHVELGDRLLGTGRHAEAIDAFQTHIALDPAQPMAWRGLARTFGALGRQSDAVVALAPLVVLDDASEGERSAAAQRRTRPGLAVADSFADESLRSISAGPGIEKHVEELLSALAEAISKLYPTDFEAYHVSPRDKLSDRSEDPVRLLCDRLAPAFGVERFDLYVHPRRIPDVVVELTHPASVMVPDYVKQLSEPQRVFMVARAFAYLARGVHPVVKLGGKRVAQLLTATGRIAAPNFGSGKFDEGVLDEMTRRVSKALSWRAKRGIEEVAMGFVKAPRLDLKEICEGFVLTANRAGALLCGDLPSAAEIIRQTDEKLLEKHGRDLVESSAIISDLFRFWASDPASDFRRRAGLG